MLTHPEKTIRQAYSLIFAKIMSILTYQSPHSLLIPAPKFTPTYYCQEILSYIVGSLNELSKNMSKMDEYIEFMLLLTQMSPYCIEYFNAHKIAQKFVHLLCQDDSPMKG